MVLGRALPKFTNHFTIMIHNETIPYVSSDISLNTNERSPFKITDI